MRMRMRRMRIVALSLLLAAVTILALAQADPNIGVFLLSQLGGVQTQNGPEQAADPTLFTDKEGYIVGEKVVFSGSGYMPSGTCQLKITKDSETYETIDFTATEEGEIPGGVEWTIPEGVPSGLYTATVYMLDSETWQEVASTTFTVNAATLHTDKPEYIVEETVVFSGVGYTPGGTSYEIKIKFDEEVLDTLSFSSQEDGSIPSGVEWMIPFEAQGGTYVAEVYNNTEPSVGVPLASTEFQVDASMEAKAEAILRELEALNDSVEADVEGVEVSLTQKISVVMKKIEQFASWIEEEKENTAANMLNAAMNNLKALIHHVEAQKGKHIDEETADELIKQAQELIEKMDTTLSSMDAKGKGKGKPVSTPEAAEEQDTDTNPGQGKGNGKGKGKGKNK